MENKLFLFRDKEYAIFMNKYMKNKFKFIGVPAPKRQEIQKDIFEKVGLNAINVNFVYEMFQNEYREFQYIAIDYLKKMKNCLKINHFKLLEYLVITKSWWDTVDNVAVSLIGHICKKYPELINDNIVSWSISDNIWIRRSSIIFQLKYKEQTNEQLLADIINKNLHIKEFFIQKAIGWSLREYSKTNCNWVKDFIQNTKLSSLAKREGEKYLRKIGGIS